LTDESEYEEMKSAAYDMNEDDSQDLGLEVYKCDV
jgi:hypothetical protein